MSDSGLIVNYQDACVYGSDLKLLDSRTAWLNDACVNFHLTRLRMLRASTADADVPALLYVDPSVVSYMIHQCDGDDLADLGRGWRRDLDRQGSDLGLAGIFVPVNDGHAAAAMVPGGGTHWSMLLIVLGSSGSAVERCLHFDSCGGSNAAAAAAVAAAACRALSPSRLAGMGGEGSSPAGPAGVTECSTLQQGNGHDCGLHALAAATALSRPSLWAADLGQLQTRMEDELRRYISSPGSGSGSGSGSGGEFAGRMRSEIAENVRLEAEATAALRPCGI